MLLASISGKRKGKVENALAVLIQDQHPAIANETLIRKTRRKTGFLTIMILIFSRVLFCKI